MAATLLQSRQEGSQQGRIRPLPIPVPPHHLRLPTGTQHLLPAHLRYHSGMETTLIILKPDPVQRGLSGRIITRFEDKGLQIIGAKVIQIDNALASQHYKVHQGKPFYDGLVAFMTRSPVIVLALRGPQAITICRKMMGATFGPDAEPGTIRGDFGASGQLNLIHGSDSPEAAERELELFFNAGEIVELQRDTDRWIFGT